MQRQQLWCVLKTSCSVTFEKLQWNISKKNESFIKKLLSQTFSSKNSEENSLEEKLLLLVVGYTGREYLLWKM